MRRYLTGSCVLLTASLATAVTARVFAENPNLDFGLFVAEQLSAHSEQLFGFTRPLDESALGPYDGADKPRPSRLPTVCTCRLVSSFCRIGHRSDRALAQRRPSHDLFVCDEETSDPAVQRVDLSFRQARTPRRS